MEFEYFEQEEYIILELTKKQLSLMGQLLHIHLSTGEDNVVGRSFLRALTLQTDCVYSNPADHKVYLDKDATPTATISPAVWIDSLDGKR